MGAIDNSLFEIRKVSPSSTARIHNRGYAGTKSKPVGIHCQVASVGVPFSGACIDVHVHVDQTRRYIHAIDMNDLCGIFGVDVLCNGCDLVIFNRNIPDCAQMIGRVDNMSTDQDKVVLRSLRHL